MPCCELQVTSKTLFLQILPQQLPVCQIPSFPIYFELWFTVPPRNTVPVLRQLNLAGCSLNNDDLVSLAETVPGMFRALTSLTISNNQGLTVKGVVDRVYRSAINQGEDGHCPQGLKSSVLSGSSRAVKSHWAVKKRKSASSAFQARFANISGKRISS